MRESRIATADCDEKKENEKKGVRVLSDGDELTKVAVVE